MNTIVLVVLVFLVIAAFRSSEKKKQKAIAAAAAAKAAAIRFQEEKQDWEAINAILGAVQNLGDLARDSDMRSLRSAVLARTVSDVRIGLVGPTNMTNHNGIGLYLTENGQEVAYGLHIGYHGRVQLIDKVCRYYGE
jgi:hypothetical protein